MKKLCYIILPVLFLLNFSPLLAHGQCRRGFADAGISRFGKPVLRVQKGELCGANYRAEAVNAGIKYIDFGAHSMLERDIHTIVEIPSLDRETVYLMRDGIFFGEFIERQFSVKGFSKRDITLLLDAELPKKRLTPKELFELTYYSGTRDYTWGKQRVTDVTINRRQVRIDGDGSLIPLSKFERTEAVRRVITLKFVGKRFDERDLKESGDAKKPYFVATQYLEPYTNKLQVFRRFEVKKDSHKTVLQFTRKQGETAYQAAKLAIFRGEFEIQSFTVQDPGTDKLELTIELR